MTNNDICHLCVLQTETVLQCFRDCSKVREVWSSFIADNDTSFFQFTDLIAWIEDNLVSSKATSKQLPLSGIVMDRIWCSRRSGFVLKDIITIPSNIVQQVKFLAEDIKASMNNYMNHFGRKITLTNPIEPYRWTAEMIKINCDAQQLREIILMQRRKFQLGTWAFSVNPGKCDVLQAEMWAIYWGLKIARRRILHGLS
jgi:hypothetical protein